MKRFIVPSLRRLVPCRLMRTHPRRLTRASKNPSNSTLDSTPRSILPVVTQSSHIPAQLAHAPVLLLPVVDILSPDFDQKAIGRQRRRGHQQHQKLLCDATFGNGGYTKALLDAMDCKVFCVDQDPLAIERAVEMSHRPEYRGRLIPILGKFSDLRQEIAKHTGSSSSCLDGIVFDIGISSNQLDDPSRGFSFRKDGPLDMRMASRGNLDESRNVSRVITAEAVVNNYSEKDLIRILQQYGEERSAHKIVRMIAAMRSKSYISTTGQLAQIISKAVGKEEVWQHGSKHPAMRTLRIYINDELRQLELGLSAAEHLLKPDGRCVVVTFHSLEDRIVKRYFRACSEGITTDELPPPMTQHESRRQSARVKQSKMMETVEQKRERQGDYQRVMDRHEPGPDLLMEDTTTYAHMLHHHRHGHVDVVGDVILTGAEPSMIPLSRKAITPDEEEIRKNSRSRSAKLRAARRTSHPPIYPLDPNPTQ
ncbi:hypothetical protein BASA60_000038 [Batrachochytrium salamandrivorans]|nr:hypothetical protein BASA60_000038 [Batrachochytrium salamandrivorans]KAH6563447.1 hypothetical protein BASA62_008541 [Batrachochytrium salamandrivorans]